MITKITPINRPGLNLNQRISPDITMAEINKKLGFKPNIQDDPHNVTASWGFEVTLDDGSTHRCAIWDYNGNRWSTYGPKAIFDELFGATT